MMHMRRWTDCLFCLFVGLLEACACYVVEADLKLMMFLLVSEVLVLQDYTTMSN